ncbi:sugar phosphate isomerase/epimerase family protein [Agarilytica rhodophyticola]|uniref:sugar phosphate isomerase/epimerase family protein n=1 Tax=Agarilytica rhodophyticola TaxID=1737490 RepID=UPI000B3481C3|nr:sugar phosphate isomerase/epimerase family protein [Agarilytica rhodophyticola]
MNPFISISSGAYNGHPLHVAFEEVAKIGGTHLELIFIHGFSNPFEESYFCEANAAEVRQLYKSSGLQCGAFAAHMDLSTAQSVSQFIARMDFAKSIGAHFMITYAAPMDKEVEFYKNMEVFVRHAEEINLIIAFENPGDGKRNIIDAARSGAEVIKRLGSDYVKFNYDFGNLMSHFREDILPEEDFLHVINDTVHLHVKDSRKIKSGWEFPAIGKGDIDFRYIFRELKDRAIDLPLCLEVPVTMTRDVYGIPKMAEVPPTLDEIAKTLKDSLDYTRDITGRS